MNERIVYIENKTESLSGPARIGRVTESKSGKTLHYRGRRLLRAPGYKWNHVDLDTGERFWVSGPRKDGADRLYGERKPVEIDEDVREEYWTAVRGLPERRGDART